jgi:hypothetical protein
MKLHSAILILVLTFLVPLASHAADVTIEKVPYGGWENNLRLSDGTVELIITLDVGPRILRYAEVGGENVFWEKKEDLGGTGEDEFMLRGGHRFWHAPEIPERTYYPDNGPVQAEKLSANSVRLRSATEIPAYVIKQMDVSLDPETHGVTIVHRIINVGQWPITLSAWGLSVMAPGGLEIIPLPEKVPHPEALLPEFPLVTWSYTDLADPRFTLGTKYILVRQQKRGPNKLGLLLTKGWAAYLRDGLLFVKSVPYEQGEEYPDMGCNYETWTNQDMLEMETLSPLHTLAPEEVVEHVEHWRIAKDVPQVKTEADVDKVILPLVQYWSVKVH